MVCVTAPPVSQSFRFALQRELLTLYVVVMVGLIILRITQGVAIREDSIIVFLIRLPFLIFGGGLVASGIVGILHFVLTESNRFRLEP